jgi:hypothetical protein
MSLIADSAAGTSAKPGRNSAKLMSRPVADVAPPQSTPLMLLHYIQARL